MYNIKYWFGFARTERDLNLDEFSSWNKYIKDEKRETGVSISSIETGREKSN